MNIFTFSARSAQKTLAAMAVFALVFSPFANMVPVAEAAAGASANLDQGANGGVGDPVVSPVNWVNGNVNANQGHYVEGQSIPYRMIMTGLNAGVPNTLVIGFDVKQSSKFAIDYITSDNRITEVVSPCNGTGICTDGDVTPDSTFNIPTPAYTGSAGAINGAAVANSFAAVDAVTNQVMKMWNGTIGSVTYSKQANLSSASDDARVTIVFTPTTDKAVLSWGGHISSAIDYPGLSAVTLSGSPYHTRLESINGGGGNQDRSLAAGAVPPSGFINVVKVVSGGTSNPSDFTIKATASTTATPSTFVGSNTGTVVAVQATASGNTFGATPYTVVEQNPGIYTASYSADCKGTVAPGVTKTCTVTNTYVAPVATLTLTKIVNNTAGGSASANQWTVKAVGPETISAAGTITDTVTPGTYTLSEEGTVARYQAGTWQCTGGSLTGDQLTLANGDSANCTVTNTYVPAEKASITLVKTVINDNGGSAAASTFKYFVNGVTEILSGVAAMFDAETPTLFTLTETNTTGYTASTWGGDCATNGTVTLGEGQSANCTITNDDIAPSITIKKVVNNGTSETPMDPEDFDIVLTATDINGTTDDEKTFAGSAAGETFTFDAGSYAVTEPSHVGYSMVLSGDCEGAAALNTTRECTVTNTYIEPTVSTVTFVKQVTSDNGGTAEPEDFSFTVNGQTVKTGESVQLPLGTYAVVENGPTSGYAASYSIACSGGSISVEQFNLGKQRTCTVTNDDIAPELTIVKHVVNDNKYNVGTAVADDFTLAVAATNASETSVVGNETGVTVTLDAGNYAVTEPNAGNYVATLSSDCEGTIAVGEKKTCTVTNNDIAPNEAVLIVKKTLTKLFGGLETVADFAFKVNDGDAINFNQTATTTGENVITLTSEGVYNVSEVFAPRYDVSYKGCEFNAEFGASYTCEIANTELPECRDGIDNDQDGFTDFRGEDQGCDDGDDDSEQDPETAITIDKVIVVNGTVSEEELAVLNNQSFNFDFSWTDAAIDTSLSASADPIKTVVTPGQGYVISEDLSGLGRWKVSDISCGEDADLDTDPSTITLNFSLGEQISCVFTNEYTPRDSGDNEEFIVVKKEVTPGSDTDVDFGFNASWLKGEEDFDFLLKPGSLFNSSELMAGEVYSISETGLPIGWSLDDVSCVSSKNAEREIFPGEFVLEDGETVTCTFVNDQERFVLEGYVWDDEDADGIFDEDEAPLSGWAVRTNNGVQFKETTSGNDGYYSFNVPRGTWTISEEVESGWDQTFPFDTEEFVHVVTVPMEQEYPEESLVSMFKSMFIATAHAGLVGTYGDYNFGNDKDSNGGGRIKRTGGDSTPTPQVLGEATSTMPVGAPNTGAGGTANSVAVIPTLFAILTPSTSVRKTK